VQSEEDVMERDKVFAGKTAIVTGASSGISTVLSHFDFLSITMIQWPLNFLIRIT
jgi:hypothetical protein